MKLLLHQRASKIVMYILGVFLALGALLDSLANALALFTPLIVSIGTACIVFFWLLITLILHRHPISWVMGSQLVRLRGLGIKPMAFAIGMIFTFLDSFGSNAIQNGFYLYPLLKSFIDGLLFNSHVTFTIF